MCIFDLTGKVYTASPFVTVKRVGMMLVLEFLNNAFIPILLAPKKSILPLSKKDTFDCYLYKQLLFNQSLRLDDKVMAEISYDSFTAEFDVIFYVDKSGYSVYVRACVDSSVVIKYSAKVVTFMYEDLKNFAKTFNVVAPSGCGVGKAWFQYVSKYDVNIDENHIVVKFPNGMRFPIIDSGSGLRVVKSQLGWHVCDINALFVRDFYMTDEAVMFRLVFVVDGHFHNLGNVKYTKKVAIHDGKRVNTVDYTKWLFLRG